MESVTNKHFVEDKIIQGQLGKTILFKQFKSGNKVDSMHFAMIDYYGNLLTTDSKSMLFVDDKSNSS